MPLQLQGNGGVTAEVSGTVFRAQHVAIKPIEYAALGHYRTAIRIVGTNVQAANSRLLTLRNTHATNLIIPTRLRVAVLQVGAVTAAFENSVDFFKLTAFTADPTTNTVTPTTGVKRGATMAAYPGGAAIRHLTLAGNAAGMTGGTLTKDAQSFSTLPYWASTAVPTAPSQNPPLGVIEALDDVNGTHPFVLAQNEGILVEHRVVGGAAFAINWYIDISWADCAVY